MKTIKVGKYVELAYEIFVKDKEKEVLVYQFTKKSPDAFVFGDDRQMIGGFMRNIENLEQGAKFDFLLQPDEAFGSHQPEYVQELDKSIFEVNGEFDTERVYNGAIVPMMTADGQRIEGRVLSIVEDKVKIDFNHPLAGEAIHYVGEVLMVRDATPEDLAPKSCGCGGSCGSACGDDGCGCGSGCGGCD